MPGLRLWNPAGVLILDTTSTVLRIFGTVALGSSNGSVTHSGFADVSAGKARFFFILTCNDQSGYVWEQPSVTLSGNTVSWTWPPGSAYPAFTLIYGTY